MAEEISPSADADYRTHLFRRHQFAALLLTFAAYTSYHASRKPLSIVKSVLGPDPSHLTFSGWPPFNGPRGPHRLGELDLAFLSSYAAGMYFAGHVGDRIDLRRFLAFGMIGSGIFTVAFGMGYWLEIHSLGFFLAAQVVCGAFQSIGWPCVVAVMGNWYGKEGRGLVMGLWSSNASVGNILGSFVASAVLEYGWGWSFVVPAAIVVMVAVLVLGFLVASPQDLGFGGGEVEIEMARGGRVNEKGVDDSLDEAHVGLLGSRGSSNSKDLDTAIGFVEAWRLPGVAPYAACLFFSKLVAYTFLYWLPFYIRHTAVAGHHLSHKTAGILSTVFDVGGVFGGVCAGYVSDKMEARAVTSFVFLVISIPTLIAYRIFGSVSNSLNTFLMFFSGFFVNGPYALITTAVAADLGTQDLIKGNSRCLATVTAIIDGTGSVGAALGPLLTGYISTSGWNSVFLMLILAVSAASLFLVRLAKAEINKLNERK